MPDFGSAKSGSSVSESSGSSGSSGSSAANCECSGTCEYQWDGSVWVLILNACSGACDDPEATPALDDCQCETAENLPPGEFFGEVIEVPCLGDCHC